MKNNIHDMARNNVVRIFKRGIWLACLGALLQLPVALAQIVSPTAINLATLIAPQPSTWTGQSATRLPDGRWLILGGRRADGTAVADGALLDATTGQRTALTSMLKQPRAGHSATLLPDGTVLVLGGIGANGALVDEAELLDPWTLTSKSLGKLGLIARAQHTATVLADGRLLIAGGVDIHNNALVEVELYDPAKQEVDHFNARLNTARLAHVAALLPSGSTLLWGGLDNARQPLNNGELFDATLGGPNAIAADQAQTLVANLSGNALPAVADTAPASDAIDVPVNQRLAVRFSKRLAVSSLNTSTVTLLGPNGAVAAKVVPLENGVLLFVTPQQELLPASRYTLFIKGATDEAGQALPFTAIGFTTERFVAKSQPTDIGTSIVNAPSAAASTSNGAAAALANASAAAPTGQTPAAQPGLGATAAAKPGDAPEEWYPTDTNFHGDWHTRRAKSPLQALPALKAPAGATALAGQVLALHGQALANVTLSIGGQTAHTDDTGRFLLTGLTAGSQVLSIDGNTVAGRNVQYGYYQVKVDIQDKQTTVLDYTIWLSKLDPASNLAIASPTTAETVLTTSRIPGLELHIPAGTVIRDHDGKIVTQLNMTAIPTDRPPFPIPNVGVPVYFTIQPGGATIQSIDANKLQGARLIYPNFSGAAPGTRIDFWNYDARVKGWYVYGQGTVTKDGKQVVPDQGVAIYEFTGAMVSAPGNAPPDGPPCGQCTAEGGDPVDLYTGLFVHQNTDLVVNDVIPLEVRRSYRSRDATARAFGVGTNLSYDLFLVGDVYPYTYQDLILPDGGRVHFTRTSSGTGYTDAVYTAAVRGTTYDGSTIRYSGIASCYWQLKLKDGGQICFPEAYQATNPRAAAAVSMSDRYGNTITFTRDGSYNLTNVTSPNGRWLQFTYNAHNRIAQAIDNTGRQVTYEYDSGDRLVKVTMPDGSFEAYTYDTNNDMLTVQDQRGNVMVSNQYYPLTFGFDCVTGTCYSVATSLDRVQQQTYADGKTNTFSYTLTRNTSYPYYDARYAKATQVDVTDERGIVKRYVFDDNGLPTSITSAQGLPEQQTVTIERDSNSLILSRTDALGRKTAYTYDAMGNMLTKTYPAGTANAVTATMTYTSDFNQLASVTDSLGHQTQLSYDTQGHLTKVTDANGNSSQFAYNSQGLVTTVTNALGKISSATYDGADLVAVTDPLNRTMIRITDGAGRPTALIDPLGSQTTLAYDWANRATAVVNPLSQGTAMQYDANGNQTRVQDAKGNLHQYAYDVRNYPTGYIDPLQQAESYAYDGNHNLTSVTDRKGQVTHYTYDGQNRLTQVTFADGSTVGYTYDAGNRLTRVADSANGTIGYAYDDFDRVVSETTSKGSVAYTYYTNGLRKTMTVSGQPTVRYSYDAGDRLTRIDQDAGAANNNTAQAIQFAYDAANRRTRTTLPNGITLNYSYDDANQLTGIVYRNADGTTLGDLSYTYDAAGRRIGMGGSLARTNPAATAATATVNAANRLTSWNGTVLSYDANGNLTSDGVNTYVWNMRNQLSQIQDTNGNVIATFQYDALGRRQGKVVSGTGIGYVYDGANVVQALNGVNVDNSQPGNVLASYLTGLGLDELYGAITNKGGTVQVTSYLTDGLGSTLRLTDGNGGKLVDYAYAPYGNTVADGNSANPFQYTGRENDGTGLYYYRNRYYSPVLQRFISSDPIGLNGGINTYAYVEGNPLSYIDPEGLAPKYQKPPNPNKKPPPEHRVPSGERERNVGHENAEEHSRQAKGQRGNRGARGARGFGPWFIYDLTCSVMEVMDPGNPFCGPPPPEDGCNL